VSNLDEALAQVRARNGSSAPMPAARIETLKPDAWLEEFDGRPLASVIVGLRTPNDRDYDAALKRDTDKDILLYLVARGLCDPKDCRAAHPAFPMPDDQIPVQLKPATIRYLYDRIEQLHLETSPVVPQADDNEIILLGLNLQAGDLLDALPPAKQARVRRLATHLIEALGTT
jgi:hypothetical protein